ncbi:MAG TPA: PPA1309 family protein [Marmoricola sp.]|nr:PPA1309 family protein [Marmoricola sp.]
MTEQDQPTPQGAPEELAPAADLALRAAVLELEKHAAGEGWDRPARLFALVPTQQLLADEPGLAEMLEIDRDADLTGSLTPVEQEALPLDRSLEELLAEMMWPDAVHGTAVVVERLVLPPTVTDLPEDPAAAQEIAATHPQREEVRMVVAATRASTTWCALRLRSHDDDFAVIEGPDLVPALLELLLATLAPVDLDPGDPAHRGEQ